MRPNLAVLRSAIAPMLTETGVVHHKTGNYVLDDDGIKIPEIVDTYTGPLLVRPQGTETIIDVAGEQLPVTPYEVTLPADAVAIIGDTVEITACHDPALVGAQLNLTDVPLDSWAVARFCRADKIGT